MPPRLRKLVLTAHVLSSVGWIGAVAVLLALAVVAVTSQNTDVVRGAYLVMEPAAWTVLVPLAIASLITGLVQSLGTQWGLFRHYWVLFKLLINCGAIVVLLMYTQTLDYLADIAADSASPVDDPSVILHSVLALLLLIVATVLAVYKPRGMTRYGLRKRDPSMSSRSRPRSSP